MQLFSSKFVNYQAWTNHKCTTDAIQSLIGGWNSGVNWSRSSLLRILVWYCQFLEYTGNMVPKMRIKWKNKSLILYSIRICILYETTPLICIVVWVRFLKYPNEIKSWGTKTCVSMHTFKKKKTTIALYYQNKTDF